MKHPALFLCLLVFSFVACKSNPEAYQKAYQRIKEKEEAVMDAHAKAAMDVPKGRAKSDSLFVSEKINLILGDELRFLDYSIVCKSFINRTNARGYFNRMLDEGYPALLVQNEDNLFRIIIGSYVSSAEALQALSEYRKTFPEAYVLQRLR